MNDVFAAQLMDSSAQHIPLNTSLREAAKAIEDVGCAVSVDGEGKLVGVVTASHITHCVGQGMQPSDTLTEDCIRTDTPTARPDTPADQLVWLTDNATVECVPVIDENGVVLGVVHEEDVHPYRRAQ